MDVGELLAAGRKLLAERPRTLSELGAALQQRWPDYDAQSLAYGVHYQEPLVQIPPRGLWGRSGRAVLSTAPVWLGRELSADTTADALVLRYLAAFGPASVADVRNWSGLTGLREVVERLRPGLRTFTDEHGRELLDVPDGPLPDPDTPASPRFMPEYDNFFLGHDDRSRVGDDTDRVRMSRSTIGWQPVLIDGFIRGAWKITTQRRAAVLRIEPTRTLSKADAAAVEAEGAALLAFMAPKIRHPRHPARPRLAARRGTRPADLVEPLDELADCADLRDALVQGDVLVAHLEVANPDLRAAAALASPRRDVRGREVANWVVRLWHRVRGLMLDVLLVDRPLLSGSPTSIFLPARLGESSSPVMAAAMTT